MDDPLLDVQRPGVDLPGLLLAQQALHARDELAGRQRGDPVRTVETIFPERMDDMLAIAEFEQALVTFQLRQCFRIDRERLERRFTLIRDEIKLSYIEVGVFQEKIG